MASVLGIDPGFSGALAVLDSDGQLSVWDTPVYEVEIGGKKRKELNYQKLDRLLFDIRAEVLVVYIERVWAMPKERASASFNFGTSYGALRMGLAAHSFSIHPIVPQDWRKAWRVPKGKDGSRLRATELLPKHSEHWDLKGQHNRADAALIALYGLRQIGSAPVEVSRKRSAPVEALRKPSRPRLRVNLGA